MVKQITNALCGQVSTPVSELFNKHILVLLDARGNVLDLQARRTSHANAIINQLEKVGNIRPLFGLKDSDSLAALAARGEPLDGFGDRFVFGEGVERFYSILPVVALRLDFLGEGRFLGVLSYSDIVPNFFERLSGCLIYVDKEDRLLGFNQSFYELFKEKFSDPHQLFNKPAGEFLSPTPREIQEGFFASAESPQPKDFRVIYEKDFSVESLDSGAELSALADFKKADGALQWTAPPGRESFFTLAEPLDLYRQDVWVGLEMEAAGPPPCVIFGNRDAHPDYLDHVGYLLGPDPLDGKPMIKKSGFVQSIGDDPLSPAASFDIFKSDRAFHFFSGGVSRFRYFDYDFIARPQTFVTLLLRPGAACRLKRLRLGVRLLPHFTDQSKLVVRINAATHPYFLLNRFDNFTLTSSLPRVAGFRLQDVTEIQRQVERLELRYQEQIKQEKRLKGIIERYRKDRQQFVGSGKTLALVKEMAGRVAGSDTSVLIQGPTGSGKEVLARYIHGLGGMPGAPFVKVDCSTLSASLMESELFGHEKGAFTGAYQKKIGQLELADGGTLFLDEVNNLTPDIQAKLLRFLNDFTIVRVGGTEPLKLNLRLIAAAGEDLKAMVAAGAFREDLYYRIAVVTLALPKLAERREDLPELCGHFLALFNKSKNKNIQGLTPAAFKKMIGHGWPGNVRELRNVLERAVLFCDGNEIGAEHLVFDENPVTGAAGIPGKGKRKVHSPVNATREELIDAMHRHQGVVQRVAKEWGVTRPAVYYQMRKWGIDPNTLRKNPRQR